MNSNHASSNRLGTSPRTPAGRLLVVGLVLALFASLAGPAVADHHVGESHLGIFSPHPSRGDSPMRRSPQGQPVELELVPGAQSTPDFGPPVVIPTPEPPPDPGDQLVGNEFGCSATCITEALLHKNHLNPDIELSMTTNVSTTKSVWVLPPGPFIVLGMPVHIGVPPTAQSGTGYTWNQDLTGLAHDASYRIVVSAVDLQGNVEVATTIFTTTPAPPDQLVGNGSGCYYDCIESGTVTPGATYDVATIEVTANTDVTFDVAVSTQAPFYINGNPVVPDDVNLNITSQTATSLAGHLTGLLGDTTYHVVVEAMDGNGFVHYAVGSFVTDPEPVADPVVHNVTVSFERVHIHENGDLVGLGEITFRTGIGPNGSVAYWQSGQYKLADGDSKTLEYETTIQVEEGQSLPDLIVNTVEKDITIPSEPNMCGNGQTLYTNPIIPGCAGGALAISAGVLPGATVEWIETLSTCETYGIAPYKANRKCVVIPSLTTHNNDYVEFDALVSFEVN